MCIVPRPAKSAGEDFAPGMGRDDQADHLGAS